MKSPGTLLLCVGLLAAGSANSAEQIAAHIKRVERGLRPAIVIKGQAPRRFGIEERMRFYKTPGVSIAVINHGDIEWARGYGVREAGTMNPVRPDTMFQAASISKPVAALVALRLIEEGRLDLDEDVNRRLVSWRVPENDFTKEKKVTLRLLLSHRAGLNDNAGFLPAVPALPLPTLREILEGSKALTPAPIRVGFEPGSRFQYSGGGYCIMEQLLEDVSGKPFPALARELVLGPLRMTNSSFEQPLSAEKSGMTATGHKADGKPMPGKSNLYPATTAAGLWTTPSDLARFIIEIQNSRLGRSNKVLSPRMTAEMLTRQGLSWGLGVGLVGRPPARFYHTGSNPGYQSEFQAYIENGNGAVVMTSADQGWRLAREILWSIAREYDWPGYDYEPDVKNVAHVAPDVLERYVGRYRLDPAVATNLVITVSRNGGHLFSQRRPLVLATEATCSRKVLTIPIKWNFTRSQTPNSSRWKTRST